MNRNSKVCQLRLLAAIALMCAPCAFAGDAGQPDDSTGRIRTNPALSLNPKTANTGTATVTADAQNTVSNENADAVDQFSLNNLFNLKVVTSSRKAESRDRAPNVTYVITKEQIAQRGYKNIYELLQTIPGYVITIKNIGDYMAQVRGIAANDNEKITIMINGHSISNLQEPILLDGPINLDNVERVEIIVGPGSVLYGANTLGSIINIITKEQDKNEITLTAGPGYRHANGTAMFAKKTENGSIMGSFSALHRDGWNAWPGKLTNELPRVGDKMGSKPESYFGFVQARMKNWTLQGLTINDNDPELDLISAGGYKDARRFDYIDEISAENNTSWTKNWGTVLEMEYDSRRMARVGTATDPATLDMGNEYDLQQRTYKAEGGIRFKTDKLYAQAGIQGERDQNRHGYLLRHSPDMPTSGYDTLFYREMTNDTARTLIFPRSSVDQMIKDTPTVTIGGYASGEYSVLENLQITLAFRLDHFSWLTDTAARSVYFNPRAAICWSPFDFWTTKAMYNKAAHTADFGGTEGMNQIWGLGNPNAAISPVWFKMQPLAVKPEIMQAFEWQNIFYIPKTRLALNTYYTTLDDFITWFFPVTNVGKFEGYGAELEVITKPSNGINVWANAAMNTTKFSPSKYIDTTLPVTEGGRFIPVWGVNPDSEIIGVPRLTAACGIDGKIFDRLFFSDDHFYFNPSFRMMYGQPMFRNGAFQTRLANAPDSLARAAVNNDKKSYWTHVNNFFIDVGVSYSNVYFKGLDIGVAVKNLTNNQTEQSQSFNTGTNVWRGRTFDLTARYTF
jgi:outer membrane receptor protein involved in Fe transport